jgi:DNA-binding NtrC family response regulator
MQQQQSVHDEALLQGKKVLVVEDRYFIARDLCRIVQALGGEPVGPAGDVASAQRSVEQARVDLALVDLNLRNESAATLIRQLAREGIRFILATGYQDWVLPQELRGAPRIEKPVSARELRQVIRRLQQ